MSDTSLCQVSVSVTVKKNGSANMPRDVTVASTTKTLYEAFAEMYVLSSTIAKLSGSVP